MSPGDVVRHGVEDLPSEDGTISNTEKSDEVENTATVVQEYQVAPLVTAPPIPDNQAIIEAMDDSLNAEIAGHNTEVESESLSRNNDIPTAPSTMAPPLPEHQVVLGALGGSDRDEEILRKKELLLDGGGNDKQTPDSGAAEENNNVHVGQNNSYNNAGGAGTEINRQNDDGNDIQTPNNSTYTTSDTTIVYNGPDAQVQIATPVSVSTNEWDPDRPIEVPEAYLVESNQLNRSSWFWSQVRRGTPILAVRTERIEPDESIQPFYKRRWGKISIVLFLLLIVAIVLMAVYIKKDSGNGGSNVPISNNSPSSSPTHAPTPDPRPTLEVVRERDVLRCGFGGYFQNYSSASVDLLGYSEDWVSCIYTSYTFVAVDTHDTT